jgi:hypothetical protein
MEVGSSVGAAAGPSIRQCPHRYRDLALIQMAKPIVCFSKFVSAGLDTIWTLGL